MNYELNYVPLSIQKKLMNRICTIFLFFCWTLLSTGQPLFVPDTDITKMGEILFQTPKTVTIGFTNKGDRGLLLTNVKPACGCTTVSFPKEEIKPGQHAQIEATFDAGILGTFYKEISILTNANEEPYYVALQGQVVKEIKDYSADYPIDLGNVRLSSNYVEFDNTPQGGCPTAEIKIVNMEHTAYKPEIMHLPDYLTAVAVPENIPAGKTGAIQLTLNSEKLNRLGLTQTSIYLARYLGDKVNDANEILVSSIILPDFSGQTEEQREKAPAMNVSANVINIENTKEKEKLYTTVYIENKGKSTLTIHQVQVFNNALAVSLGNKNIKPGKKTKLKIQVHTKNLEKSKTSPRVLLISNDPNNPKEIISININPLNKVDEPL